MRDDLAMLVEFLRLGWRRWTCPAHAPELLHMDDAIWLHCWRCGYQSPGVEIETAHVRREWAFDRMRLRFRQRKWAS